MNQKENKETIISMIVIRDFKLGRDSTKEENISKGDHVDEGKSRIYHHDYQHYHYYRHHHDDHQTGT